MVGNTQITEDDFISALSLSSSELLSSEHSVRIVGSATEYTANDIKRLRNKRGYTQQSLARILNVSTRTVENWEINKSKPNKSVYRLLDLIDSNVIS